MQNPGAIAVALWMAAAALALPIYGADLVGDDTFLRDMAETRGFMLGRPHNPRPAPDGTAVLFLRAGARVPELALYEFDVATRGVRQLLTPEQVLKGAEDRLSPAEKARRERQRVSLGGFTDFQLSEDGRLLLVALSGKLYVVRRSEGDVRELPTGEGALDPRFSPDARHIAFVRDNDLHVMDVVSGEVKAVTHGGTEALTHGLAEFVAQEEMDRPFGYWWSPDSAYLAYEEADASGVEVWHASDPARPEQPPAPTFYPRPGKANVKTRLGIVAAGGGPTAWVGWDAERYPYLALVRWDKGGPLVVGVQTRDQRELFLLKWDPAAGAATPLLTERDPAWVNLPRQMPRWLEDGSGFLWSSEKEAGTQLELRAPGGALSRVVVPPDQGFRAVVDVDGAARQVVFDAAAPDPTQVHLFRVSLDGGAPEAMTRGPGGYAAAFAKNHAIYVETASPVGMMPTATVRRADASSLGELPSVAEEPPFQPRRKLLRVGDGAGFFASIVRPRNFDQAKRYPVLVNVYGGPFVNQVSAAGPGELTDQWLADQGFVVVSADGRGTPGRGREWERALRGRLGTVPLDDQVAALGALGRRFPEMDVERTGIFGWSFGGYLSAMAVLRRPDAYKAAVAGAPVTDWLDYDTHYTERYLGMPAEEAAAYREASLLTYAADLKRPLLIVHGTADDNVYFRHSLRLCDALFRAGQPFEVLPLSGLTHMVPDPVVTQQMWGRIARHFERHLGGPEATSR